MLQFDKMKEMGFIFSNSVFPSFSYLSYFVFFIAVVVTGEMYMKIVFLVVLAVVCYTQAKSTKGTVRHVTVVFNK